MKMKTTYVKPFKTKDFDHASILYACKQKLSESYWDNGSCFFEFENEEVCEKLISDYYRDELVLGAKSLMEAIKTIKGIIHYR